ncbi:hypothetical protein CfE428DRAFT_3598 [Chthoniobacter flavus Ellin428]|uniref:Uncharacterized protein n=1 Tax=Chthoniobacter flavus Ellin428 TaxID=497964 RepID=B4D3W0_9BACT|nr:hypothetical protein [Chthoniobacter flavus]EDY18940.1 hypothetical protein CfE428DRAFT_3598 [Chthoniobacter flavus Ellin428]TCO93525.1 hypothetical protein EV701_104229 [Chthoniobacter flavus]
MFDLERAIAEWREQMRTGGLGKTTVLDELEAHLRDDVGAQNEAGVAVEEAFAASVARLGQVDALRSEYAKCELRGRERLWEAFLLLVGIPTHQPAMNMNPAHSNLNIEPRWTTYTKAAVFLAPAAVFWTFAVLFLYPKLNVICQSTGLAMPGAYGMVSFLADHSLVFCGLGIALLALLEWRWNGWEKYRRVSLKSTVFVLNTAVFAVFALMLILALVAAPMMSHATR